MAKHHSARFVGSVFLHLALLSQFLIPNALCKKESLYRSTRSIKDEFLKDDRFAQSRAITNLRYKVHNLESTVKNMSAQMSSMNTEMEKISAQNTNLQETAIEQTGIMENLNGEVETIKQLLTGHGDMIGELQHLVTHDENIFAVSNETCGEVLVGQSGFIRFTNAALYRKPYFPTACVWTIRTNHRQSIMIKTTYANPLGSLVYTPNTNAFAVEILKKDSLQLSTSNFQRKITRLRRNERQMFTGPLVFIIYELSTSNFLELHFEGMGKLTQKNVRYSHQHISEPSGNFLSDQMETWKGIELPSNNTSGSIQYTDFSSIVFSNFSTKAYLEASFVNDTCQGNDTSFLVISDILNSSQTVIVDCCERSCVGGKGLLSYADPFFLLISKKSGTPLHFNIGWEAEPAYPSSSGLERWSLYSYKCGGIVGGSSGVISYKPRTTYKNEERCIWTIVQQPDSRAFFKIDVTSNGIASSSDRLYVMELTHSNGTARADAPKIYHLQGYSSYHAHGREVYIVFYTDSSGIGQGFSLNWKSYGELERSGGDVLTNFTIWRDDTGHGTSMQLRPARVKNLYQVFMISPMTLSSRSYGLQIQINQTQPTASNCLDVTIYAAYNGLFKKRQSHRNCMNQTEHNMVQFRNTDGMVMIVLNDTSPVDSPPVAVEFDWREVFGDGDSNYITVEDNLCGGVIIGDKGVLKYKFDTQYLDNERCIWLLHAPNRTSITLDLLKDGLEICCDKILVNTIDPTTGILRNDTQTIDQETPTRTFMKSVLVIAFRTDGSTRGRGFALQFRGRGDPSASPAYRYQLRHYNEPFGVVEYPGSAEWTEPQPGVKDILVIASSVAVDTNSNNLTLSTKLNWISGVFKKERDSCTYESITFYTSPSVSGWHSKARLPRMDDMESCPAEISVPKLDNVCNTAYSAFLAIYRHIPPTTSDGEIENEESKEQETRSNIGFSFEKSATCGGVFTGSSGEISYKEDGLYDNNEKCVWIIHAPEAKNIGLKMEKSGFEQCCDLVYIYTISKDGNPMRTFNFTQGNITSTVVDGPVAIIVFTSDHSVNGRGFRLKYSTAVPATEPFPYRYHLEHVHEPARFSFEMGANDLVIAAFSREPLGHIIVPSPLIRFLPSTHINVTSIRTQIAENCVSDSLTIYNVLGKQQGLVPSRSFSALDVLKGDARERVRFETLRNGTCTPIGNDEFKHCSNRISECDDAPDVNILNVNGTAFVAVYKSANISSGDLQYRGFAMVNGFTGIMGNISQQISSLLAELGEVDSDELVSGSGSGSGGLTYA